MSRQKAGNQAKFGYSAVDHVKSDRLLGSLICDVSAIMLPTAVHSQKG